MQRHVKRMYLSERFVLAFSLFKGRVGGVGPVVVLAGHIATRELERKGSGTETFLERSPVHEPNVRKPESRAVETENR